MTRSVKEMLTLFQTRTRVPAVIGGLLQRDGSFAQSVVGTCHRQSDEPACLADQWHIGSCTKSITAALFARLVDTRAVEWNTPITVLFADLAGSIDAGWAGRTAADLLHCTGGVAANLTTARMRNAWQDQRPLNEQRSAATCHALALPPPVRRRFVYSNLSYIVIGAAIDRLAGMSYEQALRDHLLAPLSIRSLGYGAPPHVAGHGAAIRLGPVTWFRGKAVLPDAVPNDNPAVFSSAGTVHLTLTDLARFTGVFLNKGAGVISPDSVEQLLTPPAGKGFPMAKGWVPAQGVPGASMVMQGSNTFWAATVMLSKRRDCASLVVCNDGRSSVLRRSIWLAADLLASEE